jgi:tRNA A-37 threonylcarbamoyl transferase component Bud32
MRRRPADDDDEAFRWRRVGALRWRVRASCPAEALETILADPEAAFAPDGDGIVARVNGFVVKRYALRGWRKRWKAVARGSLARRAFDMGRRLEKAGLPTARVVAIAERPGRWWPSRSYLVTEEIRSAAHLSDWAGPPRAAERRLAELLANLHESGFSHADLNGTNILMSAEGDPILIDLDEARHFARLPVWRAVADLARFSRKFLNVPLRRHARFLMAYASARGGPGWRWWWERILQENARYAARKARHRARASEAAT